MSDVSDVSGVAGSRPLYGPLGPMSVQPKQAFYAWGTDILTAQDKEMLEEYAGYKFNWPPEQGYPFPGQATDIAQMRAMSGNYGDGDLVGMMQRYQMQSMRLAGVEPFSDDFLNFVSKKTGTPLASTPKLDGGGASHYA